MKFVELLHQRHTIYSIIFGQLQIRILSSTDVDYGWKQITDDSDIIIINLISTILMENFKNSQN